MNESRLNEIRENVRIVAGRILTADFADLLAALSDAERRAAQAEEERDEERHAVAELRKQRERAEAWVAELEAERDRLHAALDSGALARLPLVADLRTRVAELEEALHVAGGDFLVVKRRIEDKRYGEAASIAYDSWYRTAIAAPQPALSALPAEQAADPTGGQE